MLKPANRRHHAAYALPFILIALSLACSLPGVGKPAATPELPPPTPTMPPTPTPTPQPLPPDLVESDPPQSAELPLEGPITLYFNQPMDRASVEQALSIQFEQGVTFTWIDDATVVLYLSAPLEPESELALDLSSGMRSAQGNSLVQPISLKYQAASYLRLVQSLPEAEAAEVDPSAAIVAAFNRPVIPLGADLLSQPAAFALEPAAEGRGEWINTSTYLFYPEPPLEGGRRYTAVINPDLKSIDGGPLQEAASWGFSTAQPRLLSIEPVTEIPWPLDAELALSFNQPMDSASVEDNFKLLGPDGKRVAGKGSWDEENTVFTFTPDSLLARGTSYVVSLDGQARSRGGAILGDALSAIVVTAPALSVIRTEPAQGGQLVSGNNLTLHFSAPLQDGEPLEWISIDPPVANLGAWWDQETLALNLYGSFDPSTSYTLAVSPSLPDAWGQPLGQEFQLAFSTGPLQPNLLLIAPYEALFITPSDPSLAVLAANLPSVSLSVGSVPLEDLFDLLGANSYEIRQNYQNPDQETWQQPLELEPDRMQATEMYLSPDRAPLAPGLYYLRLNLSGENIYPGPYLIVVSNMQLTLKVSPTQALVWAVDLRSNTPLAGAPVTIYNENGEVLGSGQTDADGVLRVAIPPLEDPYSLVYAMTDRPGQETFGMAFSSWSQGVQPWEFGIESNPQAPGLKIYLYSDRPIYRPGQTVYFRAVARQAYNARYSPPEIASLPLRIVGPEGQELAAFDLPLSAYGSAHSEYTLPPEASPGYYSIISPEVNDAGLSFQVAEYRKPEIDLQAGFSAAQAQAGQTLSARLEARYFFDAPAGNLPVSWTLYNAPAYFELPGYYVGLQDTDWLRAYNLPSFSGPLGEFVSEGEAQTAADGTLTLEFPSQANDMRTRYTLEATIEDESGLPVSARASLEANPDEFYIGVRPDAWVGRAGEAFGFDIQVVDWEKNPAGARSLRAEFNQVTWVQEDAPTGDPVAGPRLTAQYTPVGSTDFSTDQAGAARLAFTPDKPGNYQLNVFNPGAAPGQGARTELLLWVGGPGQAAWPNLPNSRLRLVADKSQYQPGETAQVFIPNPFGEQTPALATLERGDLIRYQILALDPGGYNLSLPLGAEEAPNVYLSVTLLGQNAQGHPDFRQGYLNLPVEAVEPILTVSLSSQPPRAGPGEAVNFEVLVTDSAGQPVQGEFSISVVDLAALALADPNAPDIVSAFYSPQANGVRTGLSLAAYNRRLLDLPGGLGGGGDALLAPVVRENFPDTAYWNAEIVTGADGKAQVSINLPDTLTTWQVETRGLTADTRVGQAQDQIITSKDLLLRPVTPRFLVAGDHVQLAAVAQNNSDANMQVEVSLQATGFLLDETSAQAQTIELPPQGRVRVEWWGVAQGAPEVDLVFSAQGSDSAGNTCQDAARPAQGLLPVLRFLAPQSFRTAGTMDDGGEIIELVSLPRSFNTNSGELELELSPSLAAAMLKGLEALESHPYESTEQILSSFLPNLETYRSLQDFGLDASSLKARLDRNLNEGLQRLRARQNPDGGWGWWQGAESDAYMTSYVLFGMSRARLAGVSIDAEMIRQGIGYLQSASAAEDDAGVGQTWRADRQAFQQFVLAQLGEGNLNQARSLYQDREQLSPWAQALLALAWEQLSPGSAEARNLISQLGSAAVRTASGAHWEFSQDKVGLYAAQRNMHTTLSNSAVVLYALAQRDPSAPLRADAVRYLMASRDAEGAWGATYTTAWALMALNEVIKGTGELGGDFGFAATVNGNLIAQGEVSGAEQLTPVTAQLPVQRLYADYPNALVIQRDPGQGRLYYVATLNVERPADQAPPLAQGLSIERAYFSAAQDCSKSQCEPLQSASVGERVSVRLALNLPQDVYYLAVEDYIPAGSEILDVSLKTSQVGEGGEPQSEVLYDPRRPFAQGWGWWLFNPARIYDDHIAWTADYLPAGIYELTYTLLSLQPGEYRVLPARAWQLYFPEVQAHSAGSVFEIKP
ncbi:MAG: Ig-like domain-containing protein [Anaerolineales bacterium]|nr:Ig-like domain-containing protein [Anaerolineales bacterium]